MGKGKAEAKKVSAAGEIVPRQGTAFGSGHRGRNTSDGSSRGSRKAVYPFTWLVCEKIVKYGRGERKPTQRSIFSAGREPTQDSAFGEEV